MTTQTTLPPADALTERGVRAFRSICDAPGSPAYVRVRAAWENMPIGALQALHDALASFVESLK